MKKLLLSTLMVGLLSSGNAFAACGDDEVVADNAQTEEFSFGTCSGATENEQDLTKEIEYKEGVHYKVVELEADAYQQTPSVLEYIWIGCPDCTGFEPYFKELTNSIEGLSVKKRHSVKNEVWEKDARIYYALIALGYKDLIPELMEYYVKIRSVGAMPVEADFINFFNNKGVNQDVLKETMQSRHVNKEIESTKKEMKRIGLKWVPTVIVNNKYMALYNDDVKTNEDYIKLIKHLLDKKK